jgi:hypothetical protein
LVKRENLDVYDDLGPENPYWSEEDDDDDEDALAAKSKADALNLSTNDVKIHLENSKKKLKAEVYRSASPASKSKSAGSEEQPAKRQKLSEGSDKKGNASPGSRQASLSPPPPPSAAQVIKKLNKQKKRKYSRGLSASPAPSPAGVAGSPGTAGSTVPNIPYTAVHSSIIIFAF